MVETKVIWREWYNAPAVKVMTEMGTLPRYETVIDTRLEDGEGVATLIAKAANDHESESFREGGEIVILEPEEFAGTYEVTVEYEPTFYANKSDLG